MAALFLPPNYSYLYNNEYNERFILYMYEIDISTRFIYYETTISLKLVDIIKFLGGLILSIKY